METSKVGYVRPSVQRIDVMSGQKIKHHSTEYDNIILGNNIGSRLPLNLPKLEPVICGGSKKHI